MFRPDRPLPEHGASGLGQRRMRRFAARARAAADKGWRRRADQNAMIDKKRDLTPDELDKGRKVYARLSYGYHFARTPSPRTPDEQSILDVVARTNGREYVERWADSILNQARAIGDL